MGLITPAQERLLSLLRPGPQDAQAIALQLKVDASAVRRHFAKLEAMGLVAPRDVVHGRGRPRKVYELTEAGREQGPRNYPLLLALLMRKVSDRHGRKELLRQLESIARDLSGPAARAAPARVRLDLLLIEYRRLGFEAELEQGRGEVTLVQRNCPFLAAAKDDPEALCRHLDEGILRAALPGREVTLLESLAKGDAECRHRIALRRE
jgi:predicted ArsR family transcriptional regulator